MVKFKIILTLFLIIICLVKFSSLSFADQNIVWTQTENPSTGWEAAYAVTSDADYIYIVGEDASSDGGQWRIQKRKKSDGSIIWTQMENPSSRVDRARAITSDADYIYIAGEDAIPVPNDWQWRIQKRNKSDGSIVWTQTENPSTGWDIAYAIISDDSYLYIAGYDSVSGNYQWRIQKRNKSDGSTVWTQTENPSSGADALNDITSDGNYLYIAGYDYTRGTDQWRIQKRNKSDGSIVWTQTENPSRDATADAVTSDDNYIYVAGSDRVSVNPQWRIQKRNKSDGSIVWTQTENPGSGADAPNDITSDGNYLYIAGCDSIPGNYNYQWRIQKRNKSDGSIVWTQTENPSTGWDIAYAIISDDNYLYIAGYDSVPGNWQWRIQKRTLYTDIGLRIFDGTQVVAIACEPTVSSTYPLRIRKGTTTYGIVLVEPSDSKASKMRIRTNTGIKALRKL